ncbi:uncharacterized protein EV420DRAFT_1530686 [Desarmillaria tabescens]|uniref:SET domain-containing protein n=1 Tax=Armillaria tabescens TaxID=1929756 RepID=A0AA39N8W3_ARMTA|nr:uncharacterized protein EV420DRAFT_1530686 [Desarmillaria tabescens]KAK0461169.1 hypothetical protein EV420DRAFT_1530686 [Desarmillaria tabescens]
MPPNVANSAAAKKAAAKKAKRKVSQRANNANQVEAASSQIDEGDPMIPLSYGVVKDTALPEEYGDTKFMILESDPDKTWNKDDFDGLLITTQPPINMDTTLADFPGGWTECIISAPLKSTILATPGYPLTIKQPDTRAHRISPSPGKGLGMFATRKLAAGALILSERALLITPATRGIKLDLSGKYPVEQAKQAMLFDWEKYLEHAFNRMPKEYQTAFMALHNSHTQDGSGPLTGILRTNGYGLNGLHDEGRPGLKGAYSGVFNELSRLNHSCRPNTDRTFDMASFAMEIRAARDIEEGEELTTYYSDLLVSTATRQKHLEPYGVRCDCESCSYASVSDDRRREIAMKCQKDVLADRLHRWCMDPGLSDDFTLREGERLLKLVEDEGLEVETSYSEVLFHLIMVHSALGNSEEANQYTTRWTKAHISRGRSFKDLFEEIVTLKRGLDTVLNCRGEGSGNVDRATEKLREMRV